MLMLTMHQTRPLLLWLPLVALVVVHLHGILLLLVTAPLLHLALFLSRLRLGFPFGFSSFTFTSFTSLAFTTFLD